jgi:hypothetical protein
VEWRCRAGQGEAPKCVVRTMDVGVGSAAGHRRVDERPLTRRRDQRSCRRTALDELLLLLLPVLQLLLLLRVQRQRQHTVLLLAQQLRLLLLLQLQRSQLLLRSHD